MPDPITINVPGIPAPLPEVTPRDLRRFTAKIRWAESGCLEWTGARSAKGYGSFGYGPTRGQGGIPAHRASYMMFVGPIPEGLTLDHLCRNRACVNPAHLEAVDNRTNILRGEGLAAALARRTHCLHGHEFTPENTIKRNGGRARRCRTCVNAKERRRYARKRGVIA